MSYKYTIPSFKNSKNNIKEKVSDLFNFNKKPSNTTSSISNISKNNTKNFTKNISNKFKKVGNTIKETAQGTFREGFGIQHFILLLLILLILFLIGMVLYYIITDCDDKKSFGQYLIDFDLNPCNTKYESKPFIERKLEDEKEVFHISNQDFTYEQAKCKCKAYNGRLATKSEIIKAYNQGADWCTYGWSAGQTAYYPTQKCTWDKLQRGDPKHRYDCGKPGVNGGFFANPKLKFGVNCYGIKPKGEIVQEKAPVCKGKEFCNLNINYNASHKLDTDEIAPFNDKQWSQY